MKKVLGLTVSVIFLWSLSPALIKPAVRGGVSPLALTAYGTAAAFAFLAAATLARGRMGAAVAIARRNAGLLLAMAVSGWIVYPLLFYPAYRYMPAGHAFLINYLHPIFTMLLGRPAAAGVFRRAFRAKEPAGGAPPAPPFISLAIPVALCFGGVAVVALAGTEGDGAEGSFAARMLWSFLLAVAAASWGLYSNLRRNLRGQEGEPVSGADDLATLWAAGLAAAMLFAISMAVGGAGSATGGGSFADAIRQDLGDGSVAWDSPCVWIVAAVGPVELPALVPVLGSGLLVMGIGYTLWFSALSTAARAGAEHLVPPMIFAVPILGMAWSALLLGEPLSSAAILGAAMIIGGNAWLHISGDRRRRGGAPKPRAGTAHR